MGLLDFLNTDDGRLGLGLLAAAGPSAVPASPFQRVQSAYGALEQQKQDKLRTSLFQSQIDENASQNAQRAQALQLAQQRQDFLARQFPGLGGPQSGGVVAAPQQGQPAMSGQPQGGGIASWTPDQVAAAKIAGYDVADIYKMATVPTSIPAGSYALLPGQQPRYMADPSKGLTIENGQVGVLPGATQALGAIAGATEIPKAIIQSAGKVNMRKNADGTESPVSELTENPVLANIARGSTPAPARNNSLAPQPGDSDQAMIYKKEIREAGQRLASASQAGDQAGAARAQSDIDALQRETKRLGIQVEPPRYGQTDTARQADSSLGKTNESFIKTRYEPTLLQGDTAGETLTNVRVARDSLRGLGNTGWGTDIKAVAANVLSGLGIAGNNAKMYATNAQTFQSAAMTKLATELNAAKGPQTEGDAERNAKTFASLKNTPQANEYILDVTEAKAERDQAKAKFFQQALPIARQNGDLGEVEREWQKRQPSIFNMPSMTKWQTK